MKAVSWQDVIKRFLVENGIKTRKYRDYLRITVWNTYLNILPLRDGGIAICPELSRRTGYKIKGCASDPTNELLSNLLRLCKAAIHLNHELEMSTNPTWEYFH